MKRCWHKESKLLPPCYLNTGAIGLYPGALTPSASPTSKEPALLRIARHPKQTGWKCRYTYYSLGKKKKKLQAPLLFLLAPFTEAWNNCRNCLSKYIPGFTYYLFPGKFQTSSPCQSCLRRPCGCPTFGCVPKHSRVFPGCRSCERCQPPALLLRKCCLSHLQPRFPSFLV